MAVLGLHAVAGGALALGYFLGNGYRPVETAGAHHVQIDTPTVR